MSGSSVITLRVPMELKQRVERLSKNQGISMNQLAMYMISNETAQMEMNERITRYYKEKKEKDILDAFDNLMAKTGSEGKVPPWDRIAK